MTDRLPVRLRAVERPFRRRRRREACGSGACFDRAGSSSTSGVRTTLEDSFPSRACGQSQHRRTAGPHHPKRVKPGSAPQAEPSSLAFSRSNSSSESTFCSWSSPSCLSCSITSGVSPPAAAGSGCWAARPRLPAGLAWRHGASSRPQRLRRPRRRAGGADVCLVLVASQVLLEWLVAATIERARRWRIIRFG